MLTLYAGVDPYSPWSTLFDFRLNTVDSRTVVLNAHEKKYQVHISSNNNGAAGVDIEVVDAASQQTIERFTNVEGYFEQDGQLVSSIQERKIKSNVVMMGEKVTVFDDDVSLFV